jgi:hypothetical protein
MFRFHPRSLFVEIALDLDMDFHIFFENNWIKAVSDFPVGVGMKSA